MGQAIGYIRVSTAGQNIDRQLDGLSIDRVFTDKESGKGKDRPQLQAMLEHIRSGDVLHIHSIDRLARNMADLLSLVKEITSKNVEIIFHKDSLTFAGDNSPMQELQLHLMGAFAQFERSIINQRATEGRRIAKAKGVKFGRKPTIDSKTRKQLIADYENGRKVAQLARDYDISRQSIYRVFKSEGVKR